MSSLNPIITAIQMIEVSPQNAIVVLLTSISQVKKGERERERERGGVFSSYDLGAFDEHCKCLGIDPGTVCQGIGRASLRER